MTPIEAEKIIQEFGQIHELASSIGLAIPDSFLPHPKEKIKEAFSLAYKLSDEQGKDMTEFSVRSS